MTTPNCSEDEKCTVGGQLLSKKGRTDFRRQQAISAINSNAVCGDRKQVYAERKNFFLDVLRHKYIKDF